MSEPWSCDCFGLQHSTACIELYNGVQALQAADRAKARAKSAKQAKRRAKKERKA